MFHLKPQLRILTDINWHRSAVFDEIRLIYATSTITEINVSSWFFTLNKHHMFSASSSIDPSISVFLQSHSFRKKMLFHHYIYNIYRETNW